MVSLISLHEKLDNVKVGSLVKIYANDFGMISYIEYLGRQEEYNLVNVINGDDEHMSLFILQKVKEEI
jgi:hypothetical protein